MLGIAASIRHCAWADDRFLRDLQELPEAILLAEYAPGEWNVAHNISHLVGSTTWYRYCLGIGSEEEQIIPASMADVERLRLRLGEFNQSFFAECEKEDEVLTVQDGDGSFKVRRSSVLVQVVAHAVEHRTQIACAVENAGQRLDLMRYSMWAWDH